MTWFRRFIFLALFVLFIPFFVLLTSLAITALFGCSVSEAGGTCLILGADYGPVLSRLSVTGWYMLITLPIAVLVFVFWLIVEFFASRHSQVGRS